MAGIRYGFERTVPPKPYSINFDSARFRAQGVTRFRLSLSIASDGMGTYARVLDGISVGVGILAESEARQAKAAVIARERLYYRLSLGISFLG